MEALIAGTVGGIGILAAWLDLRHKMNGGGSLAQKSDLSRLEMKVDDSIEWQKYHVVRWHTDN